jgi:glucose-6-phosphate-specific signal transduction histidine kinase
MNSDPMSVALGLVIIFVFGYALSALYSAFYLKYVLKKKIDNKKFWLSVAIITIGWLVATLAAVMFASNYGFAVFAATLTILIFALNYLIAGKTLGIAGKHRIFYSLAFSVIINPIWYFMIG